MKVRGKLALPKKKKKKSCELYICIYMTVVHMISRTHDVYLYKSVKTSSCEGRVVGVKYDGISLTFPDLIAYHSPSQTL
jgi:hypothetical protein